MKIKRYFLRESPSASTSTHAQGILGEEQIRTTRIFKKKTYISTGFGRRTTQRSQVDDLLLSVSFLLCFRMAWSFYMLSIPNFLLLRLSGSLQGVVMRLQMKAMLVIQVLGWVVIQRRR
jgi:hypothetical protein